MSMGQAIQWYGKNKITSKTIQTLITCTSNEIFKDILCKEKFASQYLYIRNNCDKSHLYSTYMFLVKLELNFVHFNFKGQKLYERLKV